MFKYSVGPWNVHEGADAYGPAVRETIPFEEKIRVFKEIGFDAIQFHDDDAVPNINDYTEEEIIAKALEEKGMKFEYDEECVEFIATNSFSEKYGARNVRRFMQTEVEDLIAEKVLGGNTEMLFITAGMGGGTGTGAAPVIASMAKKKGILTVGVVTLPFKNQGPETMTKAIDGINELEKNVDSLLIINNEKLLEVYGELLLQDMFPKADEVLATAVRGITEIIKKRGYMNVDFKDVRTMMQNSGYALMGCGSGTGEHRIEQAVKNALESPLLNDYDLTTAQDFIINITVGNNDQGMTATQYSKVTEMIKAYTGKANNFKTGLVFDDDPDFGDKVNITVIVTGIKMPIIQPQIEIGNIIQVNSNFVYKKHESISEEGIELPEVRSQKIGYNNTAIRKGISFEEGKKPLLLVGERDDKSELENTPAIKRQAVRNKKD